MEFVKYCNMQPVSLQSQIIKPENDAINIIVVIYYELPLNSDELEKGYSLVEFTIKRVESIKGISWKITDISEIARIAQIETIEISK